MKKIISIILALVMMFTVTIPAFAEERESDIVCGEKKVYEIYEYYTIAFIPEKTAIYTLKCDLLKGNSVSIDVSVNSGDTFFTCGTYLRRFKNSSDTIYFCAEKDSCVEIRMSDSFSEGNFSIELNEFNPESLKVGENNITIGKDKSYFSFVPEKDGYYNFASVCDDNPAVEVSAAPAIEVENDNSGRKNDKNFDASVYLKGGNPALVAVNTKSGKGTVPCNVIITPDKSEKVEKIIIKKELISDTILTCVPGSYYGSFVTVSSVPAGALAGKDVKITSSDEDIVAFEGFDENSGRLDFGSSNKRGVAEITVEVDGVSESIKVYVVPPLIYILFYNLFTVLLVNIVHAISYELHS